MAFRRKRKYVLFRFLFSFFFFFFFLSCESLYDILTVCLHMSFDMSLVEVSCLFVFYSILSHNLGRSLGHHR